MTVRVEPARLVRLRARCADAADEFPFLAAESLDRPWPLLLATGASVPRARLRRFLRAAARLAAGAPLAHCLGTQPFDGLLLTSDARALIPRPETEQLVEVIASVMPPGPGDLVLDAGTGSGCLALALARRFPAATILAMDRQRPALALARENAARLGFAPDRPRFFRANMLDPESLARALAGRRLTHLISNPPYIPDGAPLPESVVAHEPRAALFGGADGLVFYKALRRVLERHGDAGTRVALELDASTAFTVLGGFARGDWSRPDENVGPTDPGASAGGYNVVRDSFGLPRFLVR